MDSRSCTSLHLHRRARALTCSVLAWHVQVPKTMVNILSSCDSVSVLIWASAAGWLTSLVLVCGQGILTLPEAMETWMEGMKV